MNKSLNVSDVPFLMKQWSSTNKADPATISTGSHNKYRWECAECGYTWETSVASRYRSSGKCPCHESNRVILPNVNDVLTLLPELKNYYDTEKNKEEGIDISREGFDSSMRVNWKCPDCGRQWKTGINTRSKKVNGARVAVLCPHYNTIGRKKDEVPTINQVPDLYKFWNAAKNPDAGTVKSNSTEYADWRCSNCGYEWRTTVVDQSKGSGKCACCELNMRVKSGVNDLFSVLPEAKESYDFEKNVGIDIYNMGVRNKEPVWWKCPDCGNEWKVPIISRVLGKKGNYSLRECRQCYLNNPDRITPVSSNKMLVKYWDFSKNKDRDINLTSLHSDDTVYWRCKDCGYTWSATIRGTQNSKGCPCCSNQDYYIGSHPELLEELDKIFDPEENPGVDVAKSRTRSSTLVHFHCKNCGYEWDGKLGNRIKREGPGNCRVLGCPICNNKRKRIIPYTEQYPELAAMYNEELSGRPLDSLRDKEPNRLKVFWNCPTCHRTFPSTVSAMISSAKYKSKGCPFCAHRKLIKGESFGDFHPEFLDEYAEENEIDPFNVFPFCNTDVLWRCPKHSEYTWTASFCLRHMGGGACPICNRTRLVKGINTFADVYSEYLDMYSESNEHKADEIFYNSSLWFNWKCRTCHNEYGARIKDVLSNDESCPYCDKRRPTPGVNSLQALYPDIAKWYSAKNLRTADEIFPDVVTPFVWDCPDCGGEYNALMKDVVSGEYTCPFCDDRLTLPGFNDFATRHPDLMKEYNYIANYITTDSNNISEKSNEPLWWICPKNPEHHYRMSPARKLLFQKRNKEACPYCKGLRRKKRHFI